MGLLLGYLCITALRFTHEWLNFIFACAFLLLPFLAIRPVFRLGGWSGRIGVIVLTPMLAISLVFLSFNLACGNFGRHPELVRDLSTIEQDGYSVHLIRDTSGGALGPHGLIVQQRRTVVPGLYLFRSVDFLNHATDGTLTAATPDGVRVHVSKAEAGSIWNVKSDAAYSLKRHVYF